MYKFERIDSEIARKVQCRGRPEYYKITSSSGNHSYVVAKNFIKEAERIKNFEVLEDDIWVCSFPKTGTTWTQEMVWLLSNNLDYERARKENQEDRFPFFEFSATIVQDFIDNSITKAANLPRPRFIKSHLHKAFLPDQLWTKKPKIIYVTRNPKDTVISLSHHYRHISGYEGTKEDFYEAFMHDCVGSAPFFSHVLEFWKIRNEKNVFYVNYEEMKRDLRSVVIRMAEFLDKSVTSVQTDELLEYLSFDSMKKNNAVNKDALLKHMKPLNSGQVQSESFEFIRKGKARAYETEMSPEMNAKFDKWIEDSLQGTDLQFEF